MCAIILKINIKVGGFGEEALEILVGGETVLNYNVLAFFLEDQKLA